MSEYSVPLRQSTHFTVVAAPPKFDLLIELEQANAIWVVSAFARNSGWSMIRGALVASSAQVVLLTGLDFCLTEPSVLRDWLGEAFRSKGAEPYLHVGKETFHPKVFLVEGEKKSFALVGSGNLTAGGLVGNVECFAYVGDEVAVAELKGWLGQLRADLSSCVPLTLEGIEAYEPIWEKAEKARRRLRQRGRNAIRQTRRAHEAQMKDWERAVGEAREFLQSAAFNWHHEHHQAAQDVLRLLHHPTYDFSKQEWSSFYDIWNMGHLIPIRKFSIFDEGVHLRQALRNLADATVSIEQRVDAILSTAGAFRVPYLGINAVSKILACQEPHKWPVWNGPVETALRSFEYKAPAGATQGQKYRAFASLMATFLDATGAADMLALDCFLPWKAEQLKKQ